MTTENPKLTSGEEIPPQETVSVDNREDTPEWQDSPDVTPKSSKAADDQDRKDYEAFLNWKRNRPADAPPADEDQDPEVYVHLANGDVERVKTSELPPGGANGHLGWYEKDNAVHAVIGVYPVETEKRN